MKRPGAPARLSPLALRAADEPVLLGMAGRRNAVIAVPETARAGALAALAAGNERRPVLVAVPTGTAAEQLAADLEAWFGPHEVALLPAWETLPFERVSPAVHTMGERTRTLWRLRSGVLDPADPDRRPSVVVAGVRALLQKLAPTGPGTEPIEVSRGDVIDIDLLCERLAFLGYRREHVAEHRGEFARRGAIVDVFPSTSDVPVRIDMWGDEVDRLTSYDVADQRTTGDLARVRIFPARELMHVPGIAERASALVAAEPWGREQWERLAEGQVFDGMESWLPWLADGDTVAADLWYRNQRVASMMQAGPCPMGRNLYRCRAVYVEAIPGSSATWQLVVKTKAGATTAANVEVPLPNKPMVPQRHVRKVCELWNKRNNL